MNEQILIKAKELLKTYSKEYVLNKLMRERSARQSITMIIKAVNEASNIKQDGKV